MIGTDAQRVAQPSGRSGTISLREHRHRILLFRSAAAPSPRYPPDRHRCRRGRSRLPRAHRRDQAGQIHGGAHRHGMAADDRPAGPGPVSTKRTRSHTSRTRRVPARAFSRLSGNCRLRICRWPGGRDRRARVMYSSTMRRQSKCGADVLQGLLHAPHPFAGTSARGARRTGARFRFRAGSRWRWRGASS